MTKAAGLVLASDLVLPIEYTTQTAAIVAQRRKGKTYTGSVLAEELYALGQPWVALDPTGAWWGMRAAANGRDEGLPVIVLGGQHGVAPIERTSGRIVADLVVNHPGWYVIDLSLLESRAAEREFATDFGEALLRLKRQPGKDFPMHLFVDEADMFAPQERESGDQRMLGAYQAIVRRGGLHGLGSTLITQRPALLNKSVLTQLDVLILLRLVAGQDQDAVDKNYLSRAGAPEARAELMGSLASLKVGEAWVWEPGADPPLFQRVKVRERTTFNSSATPRPGEHRVEPAKLADVDLAAVMESMAAAIQRAEASDVSKLRQRISQLERELGQVRKEWGVEVEALHRQLDEMPPETVEVPVFEEALLIRLEEALTPATALMAVLQELLQLDINHGVEEGRDVLTFTRTMREDLPRAGEAGDRSPGGQTERPAPGHSPVNQTTTARRRTALAVPAERPDPPPPRREPGGAADAGIALGVSDPKLSKAERLILTALAPYPIGRTRRQVAFMAGYSANGGGFKNALSSLRTKELILAGPEPLIISPAGLDALGEWKPLPTGRDLAEHWLTHQLLGHAEREILRVLLDAWPDTLDRADTAARTVSTKGGPYEPDAGGFKNALSKLRTLELITGSGDLRVSDDLIGD